MLRYPGTQPITSFIINYTFGLQSISHTFLIGNYKFGLQSIS